VSSGRQELDPAADVVGGLDAGQLGVLLGDVDKGCS
jgi:hypothetical protein